jgi:hypothetical protein
MSDGEIEVESPSGYAILPKEVTEEIGSIKLFNKWSYEDVEIRDISLTYGAPNSSWIVRPGFCIVLRSLKAGVLGNARRAMG